MYAIASHKYKTLVNRKNVPHDLSIRAADAGELFSTFIWSHTVQYRWKHLRAQWWSEYAQSNRFWSDSLDVRQRLFIGGSRVCVYDTYVAISMLVNEFQNRTCAIQLARAIVSLSFSTEQYVSLTKLSFTFRNIVCWSNKNRTWHWSNSLISFNVYRPAL